MAGIVIQERVCNDFWSTNTAKVALFSAEVLELFNHVSIKMRASLILSRASTMHVCGKAMNLIGFLNHNSHERIKLQAVCVTSIRLCFIYLGSLPSNPINKLEIPYSGKVWRGESLANLANRRRFAKLKPSKLIPTIDNPLADLFIRQTFFR